MTGDRVVTAYANEQIDYETLRQFETDNKISEKS